MVLTTLHCAVCRRMFCLTGWVSQCSAVYFLASWNVSLWRMISDILFISDKPPFQQHWNDTSGHNPFTVLMKCLMFTAVTYVCLYRVSQEECARLREGVPCVKVYRYNPKHLCPELNGYGDNGLRKVWSSRGSTHCTCQLTIPVLACGVRLRQVSKG